MATPTSRRHHRSPRLSTWFKQARGLVPFVQARRHATLLAVPLIIAILLWQLPAAAAGYDWPQFDGNPQHSGNNTQESQLSTGTVSSLTRLFRVALPGVADGAPAFLSGVSTPSGTRDLLFLTTRDGRILAVDAHSGTTIWSHQNGPGTCTINNQNGTTGNCYTTSSPAVDPNRQYVYSYGLDGNVHKYLVGDGSEITGSGWPEATSLKDYDEKGSSALSVATAKSGTSYLYVTHSGYPGDAGDYQGHVTAINLADGSQHVFNSLCSNQTAHFVERPGTPDCSQVQSGVWARPGVVYDPATDRIYFSTGNGLYAPSSYDWGDSVLALHPDGTGTGGGPVDSYTPTNYQQLDDADADLGSTAPAVLPPLAGSAVQNLGVQSGKDGMLRLLNLADLSSQGGPGHTGGEVSAVPVPQAGAVRSTLAVWTNPGDGSIWVFVANDNGLSGLQLVLGSGGTPTLQSKWTVGTGATSPLVANDVLYVVGGGSIRALDPLTGTLLWQDTSIGGIHWESPVVANGVLYVTDESGNLTAYFSRSSLNASYSVSGEPATFITGGGLSYSVTVTNTGTGTWPAGGTNPVDLGVHVAARGGGFGTSGTDSTWYTNQRLSLPADVPPGSSVTLTAPISAPLAPGSYVVEYQMVQEGIEWFPSYLDHTVSVAAPSAAVTPPAQGPSFSWGQTSSYQVTVQNTGTAAWPASGPLPVRLGVHFAARGGGFGASGTGAGSGWATDQRYTLPSDVAAGASVTLSISVAAPAAPGSYVLEYEMVHEGVAWFQQYLDQNVLSAAYAPAGEPSTFNAGATTQLSITLTNNGLTTWPSGGPNPVHLGVHFATKGGGYPASYGTGWLTDQRFALPADVPRGGTVTLSIAVTAPGSPGSDVLEYQMVQEGVDWFPNGSYLDSNVTVS